MHYFLFLNNIVSLWLHSARYAFSRILQLIKNQQTKYLSLVFDLISKVEKGELIPSLNELEKKVDQKNKL